MKTSILITCTIISAILIVLLSVDLGFAQQPGNPEGLSAPQELAGTAFTYQGQLKKAGAPVNLDCDFQFSLYNAASDGSTVGPLQDKPGVSVTGGLFSVALDFGSDAFNGEARWLGIQVTCPPDVGYTDLGRQKLTPAPLALSLPGLMTQQNAVSPNLIGGYNGNGVTSGVYGATISGGGESGSKNQVTDNYGVVGGGINNQASKWAATVGGGDSNQASGKEATVPGGNNNTALGDFSFAAGRRANANKPGCFVWGDESNSDVSCNNDNRWVARASGGVYFYTNNTLTSGSYLAAGGSSWNVVSNRALKQDFQAVDPQTLLTRLADIPISTWSYKAQAASIRHIGPMADDFNGLLPGLGGEGVQSINSLDADGVALTAIQGLYQRYKELEEENAGLAIQVTAQQKAIEDMQQRLTALEQAGNATHSPHSVQSNTWLLLAGLLVTVGVGGYSSRRVRGAS